MHIKAAWFVQGLRINIEQQYDSVVVLNIWLERLNCLHHVFTFTDKNKLLLMCGSVEQGWCVGSDKYTVIVGKTYKA